MNLGPEGSSSWWQNQEPQPKSPISENSAVKIRDQIKSSALSPSHKEML